jgi:hypothetical protein
MNQFAPTKALKKHDRTCGDLMTMAERELAAFFRAATELFGSEQAKVSAEDWLQELMAIDINDLRISDPRINDPRISDLSASTRQWRLLTVQAAARLASRVTAESTAIAC